MAMTTFTRLGYCEKCFNESRPNTGDLFIVFGKTSNRFKSKKSEGGVEKGLVPHIYKEKYRRGNVVYYKRICCMNKCGSSLETVKEKDFLFLNETKWIHEATSLSNWNALVNFRDHEFVI